MPILSARHPLPFPAAVFLLAALSLAETAAGQGPVFQTINTVPRSRGLGEAAVALRGYAGAGQLNPATIGMAGTVQAGTTFDPQGGFALRTPWLRRIRFEESGEERALWMATPSLDVKSGRWAFAYGFRQLTLEQRQRGQTPADPPRTTRAFDRSHDLTLAYDLSPGLTVGVGGNLIRSEFAPWAAAGDQQDRHGTALSMDLGVYYEHPLETAQARIRPAVAWSLTDFGAKIRYANTDQDDALPIIMRAGASVEAAPKRGFFGRPLVTVGLYGALSKDIVRLEVEEMESGAVRYSSHGPFRALFTAWQPIRIRTNATDEEPPVYETVGAWEQTRRHGGIELSLLRIASVQLGHHAESAYVGGRTYSTFGWGLDLYYLALTHAQVISDDDTFSGQSFWSFAARVPIGEAPDNFWPALRNELSSGRK